MSKRTNQPARAVMKLAHSIKHQYQSFSAALKTAWATIKETLGAIAEINAGYHEKENLAGGITNSRAIFELNDSVVNAIQFFYSFNEYESHDDFCVLEKNGVFVKYTWDEKLVMRNYPFISDFKKEQFQLI